VCSCTPIFPQGVAVHPEELDKLFRPLLACTLFLAVTLSSVEGLLPFSPIIWYVSFEDLKPADLDDHFNAIRIVRVAGEKAALDTLCDDAAYGEKAALDTLCDDAAYVGCSLVSVRYLWRWIRNR
jgi:hypothetical protein